MTSSAQGQSAVTELKQDALQSFIAAHANVVRVIQEKYPWAGDYTYVETNAGSGYNDKVGCVGSPVIATRQLAGVPSLRFRCLLIEKREDAAAQLEGRIAFASGNAQVFHGDHATLLPSLKLPKNAFGLVYADPNALRDAPVEALRAFFGRTDSDRIDVLYNLDAHQRRRVLAAQQRGNPGCYQDLHGVMRRIGKKHWWVRDAVTGPGARWTFLFGSNNERLNIRNLNRVGLRMHPIKSAEGRQLLARLTGEVLPGKPSSSRLPYRSYREYLAHPVFLAVRQQVMARSGGWCELCRNVSATEVHHRIYPDWGAFDDPNGLIAVCHQCHCKAHGVTR